jgi:hypothetical protein
VQPGAQRSFLQLQEEPQWQSAPQLQAFALFIAVLVSVPQLIILSLALALRIVRLDVHDLTLGGPKVLESFGYDMASAAAGRPNIRLNVRLRCAESANPAACAAWVRLCEVL